MVVFRDELFDRQWLRTVSHASYGGAEIGECLAVAKTIASADSERWFNAWSAMAERRFEAAEKSAQTGNRVSARGSYLRASNYWRAAWTFLLQGPLDPRVTIAYDHHRTAFERAAALMRPPGEPIRIRYEGAYLHGYFVRADDDRDRRPTLIVNGGYDSTAEEAFLLSGAAAIQRGYNCLVFDGPGQGAALIKDGLFFRPDWEQVVGPVIDYALTRPEVSPGRIALMGISFGGYLASRAASVDPRVAALIADPGQRSLFDEMKQRMPAFVARRLLDDNGIVPHLLDRVLRRRLRHVSKGWAIRRGLLVHGVGHPLAYLRLTALYYVEKPEAIRCPTLICAAENDEIGVTARDLYDALVCPKTFIMFTAADGAGDHCEAGARTWFNQRAFDWLDQSWPK
jgi:pimeloyl-ACP methyl ester carboxylesterase